MQQQLCFPLLLAEKELNGTSDSHRIAPKSTHCDRPSVPSASIESLDEVVWPDPKCWPQDVTPNGCLKGLFSESVIAKIWGVASKSLQRVAGTL